MNRLKVFFLFATLALGVGCGKPRDRAAEAQGQYYLERQKSRLPEQRDILSINKIDATNVRFLFQVTPSTYTDSDGGDYIDGRYANMTGTAAWKDSGFSYGFLMPGDLRDCVFL